MAAPRKPKAAGVRTAKSNAKAPSSGATKAPEVANAPTAATPAAAAPVVNGNGGGPSAEIIRLRAYEVYCARNGGAGDELSDWLAAEREILERFAPHD